MGIVGNSQFVPAFGSTIGKNPSAIFRTHPGTEPVLIDAFAL
jgi:hypothetical protein